MAIRITRRAKHLDRRQRVERTDVTAPWRDIPQRLIRADINIPASYTGPSNYC